MKNCWKVIKTQAILFENYKNELEPYKYAGYPMLVTTMNQEVENENLYAEIENELLSPSVELAYHTVCCSSLNAEELNREKGSVLNWRWKFYIPALYSPLFSLRFWFWYDINKAKNCLNIDFEGSNNVMKIGE